jgi:hypothetical protein
VLTVGERRHLLGPLDVGKSSRMKGQPQTADIPALPGSQQ